MLNNNIDKEALMYLNDKAASHSKSKDLMKSARVMEKYLGDQRFSSSDYQLLFQLRTRMLSVKDNFPSLWNNNVSCRTCNDAVEIESQEHLLHCKEIMKYVNIPMNMKYRDIFRKIIRHREILLNCDS